MTSTSTSTSTTRRAGTPASVALLLVVLALLAGCSGGSDLGTDPGTAAVGGGEALTEPAPAAGDGRAGDGRAGDDSAALSDVASSPDRPRAASAVRQRAVVSTGTVSLESRDVEAARFDVQRVVDATGGEVTDEQTGTDDEGDVRRSRLVLRVPAARFGEAMAALADLGSATLRSAERVSEDVTTQVIDTEARVRAQEASLERVELLLTRAERLSDVVAIEAQLTRRQAELDSLRQQQAWLADQTTLSTITVLLERPEEPREREREESGFLAGLAAGWDALRGSTVAVLTAVGAALPFAVLLLAVGVPAWLVLRRLGAAPAGRVRGGSAGRTP